MTRYARDVKRVERQREVMLQFDNVSIDNDGDVDLSVPSSRSVNLDASFLNHVQSGAQHLFGIRRHYELIDLEVKMCVIFKN